MSIEAMAVAFVAATKKRAQARSHLSALRKKWLDDNDTFFDQSESDGMKGYHDMMGALHDREIANAEYRRAKSRLFRACALGVASGGDTGPFLGPDEVCAPHGNILPCEACFADGVKGDGNA